MKQTPYIEMIENEVVKTHMNQDRAIFYGDMPKVGIRPVIDGRKRVRDDVEPKTWAMARKAAALISENLRYVNGQPVECVMADTCIGGVEEASRCTGKFRKAGVGLTLSVTVSWCYGTETMDDDPLIPKAVWGFNGTERSGAVYLSAVIAAHNQKGLPAFSIYGHDVQDKADDSIPPDVCEKILGFVRAGIAVAMMRGKSYLAMGGVCMGIAGSMTDDAFLQQYLGMRLENIDMCEFTRRIEAGIYDQEEYARALRWTRENCREGADNNPPEYQHTRQSKDNAWEMVVKMMIIARDLMIGNPKLEKMGYYEESMGHHALAAGFQGQRQWSDYLPNGDFMEALLCSSFDWNGIREPYILATENDCLNGISMLFGHLLTGAATVFADVRTYWSPDAVKRVSGVSLQGIAKDGIIHLINSGAASLDGSGRQLKDGKPAMKPYWEISNEEAKSCLEATTWYPAHAGYFRGGGYSSNFLSRGGMPVTMIRLNLIKHRGPVLQIAEGYTVDLPENVHKVLDERTDPTWPTTWFVPRLTGSDAFESVYSVMSNWGANHCAIAYGHIGDDLITMASMLRIPVAMHNVEEKRIHRPAVWSAMGTKDLEGADFRTCQDYGPLYR